jgi:hypothetical protein
MIASVSATAVAASAQELPKPEQRATVAEFLVAQPPQNTGQFLADSIPSAAVALPEAPAPVMKPLSSYHAAFAAAPQQQGGPSSRGTYPNTNKRKYILIGVICAAAIIGGIIIATQHD